MIQSNENGWDHLERECRYRKLGLGPIPPGNFGVEKEEEPGKDSEQVCLGEKKENQEVWRPGGYEMGKLQERRATTENQHSHQSGKVGGGGTA